MSIYRLKLASADEDLRLHLENAHAISLQLQSVLETNQGLEARVAALTKALECTEASCSAQQESLTKLKVRGRTQESVTAAVAVTRNALSNSADAPSTHQRTRITHNSCIQAQCTVS